MSWHHFFLPCVTSCLHDGHRLCRPIPLEHIFHSHCLQRSRRQQKQSIDEEDKEVSSAYLLYEIRADERAECASHSMKHLLIFTACLNHCNWRGAGYNKVEKTKVSVNTNAISEWPIVTSMLVLYWLFYTTLDREWIKSLPVYAIYGVIICPSGMPNFCWELLSLRLELPQDV